MLLLCHIVSNIATQSPFINIIKRLKSKLKPQATVPYNENNNLTGKTGTEQSHLGTSPKSRGHQTPVISQSQTVSTTKLDLKTQYALIFVIHSGLLVSSYKLTQLTNDFLLPFALRNPATVQVATFYFWSMVEAASSAFIYFATYECTKLLVSFSGMCAMCIISAKRCDIVPTNAVMSPP